MEGDHMQLHGRILGIPYDFRRPSWSKVKSHYWNPDDERIFIPRAFGIGWDVNLYRFKERYPALFYTLLCLTIASEFLQSAVYLRMIFRKRRKDEE
jgi:hypothetical protein